jgi:hypothetical protein
VAPSLPGYGFSHVSNQRRLNIEEIAALFHRLMTEVLAWHALRRGRLGAFITGRLGYAYPQNLISIHLNMMPVAPHPSERTDLSRRKKPLSQSLRRGARRRRVTSGSRVPNRKRWRMP